MIEKTWQFELNDEVNFVRSNETGVIIGRAEYAIGEDCYYVRYCAGDGRQVDAWQCASALVKAF